MMHRKQKRNTSFIMQSVLRENIFKKINTTFNAPYNGSELFHLNIVLTDILNFSSSEN